jgi:aminoglycoside/choline kinase family phosphotransferase
MTLPSDSTSPDARLQLLTAWLESHANRYALDLATLVPASSDASFRRYFRLKGKNLKDAASTTLIAVDAPPPEKCREFVQVAQLLSAAGVNVPQVLEVDFEAGFMLVTDLGTTSYLSALTPDNAKALMRDALDALIRWQLASKPGVLPPFDEAFLRREMELLPECPGTAAGFHAARLHAAQPDGDAGAEPAEPRRARLPGRGLWSDYL